MASLILEDLPYWQHLTSSHAADLAAQDPLAVLPLGAIEQHGPHLPLSTDLDIGMGLLQAAMAYLPADFPLTVLPPQAVGESAEHAAFTGTLSLPPSMLMNLVVALGEQLSRAGIRRLLLHNSHGGNRAALDQAGLVLRRTCGMLVVKCHYVRFPLPDDLPLDADELRHGFHGGALETALMMHFQPQRVREAAMAHHPSVGQSMEKTARYLAPEGVAPFSWMAQDLNPAGVVGDATAASAELGARLSAHYGKALAELMHECRSFDLEHFHGSGD